MIRSSRRLLLWLAAWLWPVFAFAQTYSWTSEPYSWVSTSGHTVATWGGGCTGGSASVDDDITAEISLGFTYSYGGTAYTTVRIMSNGRLQFNNRYCANSTGPDIPSGNLHRTMRGFGADLDPSVGGSVTYGRVGSAPNRSFVVTWTNVPEWNWSSSSFNLQMIVHENGDFVYQWGSIVNTSGIKPQIGWELTPSDWSLYSYANSAALVNRAIRWSLPRSTISGTVFEDINYGGGAGRSLSASSGAAVSGATVELYNASGSFVSSTTTSASGAYSFTVTTAGTYHVRVASQTVLSTRSGSSSSLRPVLTWRADASTASATAVTDNVGGTNPALADPGAGSSGTAFNTSSYAFASGLSGTAHAVTPVAVTLGTNRSGIDFGFNFDTVTNTNDSGQGSLRQAITNANTLGGDASLAQSGRTAAKENLIFMISNGSSGAGLRSSFNYTSGGVATVAVASALPAITQALVIDGSVQPGFNTTTRLPVVELNGAATAAGIAGLVVSASNCVVRSLAINRFGGNGITLSAATSGQVVSGNHIGTNAAGTAASANGGHGVDLRSSSSTIGGTASGDGNLISGNSSSGVYVSASGATITGNRIGSNAAGSGSIPNQHGIRVASSTTLAIGGSTSAHANTIRGNSNHGLWFESGNSGVTVQGNTITANGDRGIVVSGSPVSQVDIRANAISANGSLGIDLGNDGVTGNTGSLDATKPNAGMNHPIFSGAGVATGGGSITVYGYVGTGSGQAAFAGARVEVFKAAADANGYGEGLLYLGSLTADANGQFSGTLAFAAGSITAGDTVTATATDGSGNTSEFGPNWTSTTVAGLSPAGFNAFDSGTAAGSLSGTITTRIAGASSSLDVIALNSAGTGLHPSFTGGVSLTWLDARDDSGAASGSCRASWSVVGSAGGAGSASFSNASRVTVSITPPAAAKRVMRLRMSYTNALGTTTTACSGDAFAVIPASLTLAASDADAATAGSTRSLANSSASGGVVHRAGRAFTVSATARDALGNVMTGYDGTPALAVASCLLPAGCSAGSLSASSASAVAGVYSNASVSYAEVGAITLQLTDTSYAAVDAGDTPLASRTIASAAATVGRFVPDSYALTVSTNGTLATANAACLAAGSGATFFGQGFGWTTAPQVTVTARNAAGGTTALWGGTLMKLAAGSATPTLAVSSAGSATLSSSLGSLAFSALGAGQARYTASTTDRFVLDLPAATQQVSTTPGWSWTLALTDASEAAVAGNPTLSANVTQSSVGFDQGAVFHSGRLALAAAHGDARSGVRQLVQLQRWSSAGWVTMTEDRGCVSVAAANLALASGSGVFATNLCAAPLTAAVTTRGGRAWLAMPATPAGAHGRVLTRLAGDSSGSACTSGGATQPLVNLNLPWLMGGGSGPTALATWGRANRDLVLRRETW